ncbi:hypothetical protein FMM58_02255 [Campylobacter sp. LR291e]|uniref:hypothetical protein n=1 Tax=Campylobacter sp. LR291e TaxID=2593546 RepID=UPI001238FC53|nr:hypothetical protein [Campylobacter sp. LR291e]KAA6233446.1 hypothetical protein FMM58_02255 [Campylobacter sp. LR291e]
MKALITLLSLTALVFGAQTIIPLKRSDVIVFDYIPSNLDSNGTSPTQVLVGNDLNASNEIASNEQPVQNPINSPAKATFMEINNAKGVAKDKNEALHNALNSALTGLGISNDKSKSEIKQIKLKDELVGQIEQNSAKHLKNASNNKIDAYQVNNINQNEDGLYELELSTYKFLFNSNSKLKVVLFDSGDATKDAALKQTLSEALTKSTHFQLLDRDSNFKQETKFLKSEDASVEESYKLGSALGADYILDFAITGIQKAKSSNISYNSKQEKYTIAISYKFTYFPTREVLFSDTLTTNVRDNDLKKAVSDWQRAANEVLNTLQAYLFGEENNVAEEGKGATYERGEDGGVKLGF